MPTARSSALSDVTAAYLDILAADLAAALEGQGIATSAACLRAGIHPSTPARFLRRESATINLGTLLRLAAANGVPVEIRVGRAPRRPFAL